MRTAQTTIASRRITDGWWERLGPARKVALVFALPCIAALIALPFLSFRPNRILSGEGFYLWELGALGIAGFAVLMLLAISTVAVTHQYSRAFLSMAGVAGAMFLAGQTAENSLIDASQFARVSLGGGFWVGAAFFALAAADALMRLELRPLISLGLTVAVAGIMAWALAGGFFDSLSILQEYQANADSFAAAFRGHLLLVGGSLLPALVIGLPLGRLCAVSSRARSIAIPILNILQTTPSIAMFGLLMVPLAALVAAVPQLRSLGIGGIGVAPAIIALTLYSLLPIVANTITGFASVPRETREAGRAMGMTNAALLRQVELPLAAPVILTGVRIVVVQNIGLAAIAALIGGGGFGTLVFRGMGQTAMDLVLLGTLPIVALAILASIFFDAAINLTEPRRA